MTKPTRLHSLDVLRGLAALCVVCWHWQHMFFNPAVGDIQYQRAAQPFFFLLRLFYGEGWRCVDLFFVLSGFVFYWLYADGIASRQVDFKRFAALRGSRLYPLHLLTFSIVLGLQAIYSRVNHVDFVYERQGLIPGVLDVVGVHAWFNHTQAFNGPFWSVSIEIFVYLVFFLVCLRLKPSWKVTLALVFAGACVHAFNLEIARGLIGFFLGGTSFFGYRNLSAKTRGMPWMLGLGGWILLGLGGLALLHRHLGTSPNLHLPFSISVDVVFSVFIIFIVLAERRHAALFTRLSFLGDISFSVYLIHFPLQITFVLVNQALGGTSERFYQPWTMLLFTALLFPLSFLSYHAFERPAQNYLRGRLGGARLGPVQASASTRTT